MDKTNRPQTEPGSPPEPHYEFTSRQNDIISRLASDMNWVAIPLMIISVLYFVSVGLTAVKAYENPRLLIEVGLLLLAGILYLLMGTWLGRAARSFQSVVTTQGGDIHYLMNALQYLGKIFGLLSFFVKIYVVLVIIALVVGLILMITGAIAK